MKRQRTTYAHDLTPATKRLIVRTAKALLVGVGQLPSLVEQFPLAVHYRRAITDRELAGLPQWWCEIAPVHEAGRGLMLEENT